MGTNQSRHKKERSEPEAQGPSSRNQGPMEASGPRQPCGPSVGQQNATIRRGRANMPRQPPAEAPRANPANSVSSGTPCPTVSKSKTYRLEGNGIYGQYQKSSNDPNCQRTLLQSAIRCYTQAVIEASKDQASDFESRVDLSSACKNRGTASARFAEVLAILGTAPEVIHGHWRKAIEYLSQAVFYGRTCMHEGWLVDVMGNYRKCMTSALEQLEDIPHEKISGAIERLMEGMREHIHKSKCWMKIADIAFHRGLVALGSQDFRSALHAFHDCRRPIMEAGRFLQYVSHKSQIHFSKEILVMEEDLRFHLATAESLQAIRIGDDLLKVTSKDSHKYLDLVYDVVDWYRKAVLGAREIEVEVEAMALSRLGFLFDEVLNVRSRAKQYFLRCVQLGVSLNRKDIQSEEWFKTAMEALKRYQEEAAKTDDHEKQKEQQKFLDELSKELAQLSEANKGPVELIRFIYATFPPKDPKNSIPEEELGGVNGNKKKGLLKAILHYHPDKQDVAEYGKKWQVLCGEITKALTAHYESCKFA